MKWLTRVCSMLFLIVVLTSGAMAFRLREFSLEEKVAKSDAVIIGTVTAVSAKSDWKSGAPASIRVETTLKGAKTPTVTVITLTGISEANPDCCALHTRYLLFLVRVKDGRYEVVDGHFGAYRLDRPSP